VKLLLVSVLPEFWGRDMILIYTPECNFMLEMDYVLKLSLWKASEIIYYHMNTLVFTEMAGSYGGPSEQQWLLLLDLVSHDSELRTGQFTGPMGKPRVERKWNEVAAQLNAIPGSNKTGRLWKEVSRHP